MRKFARACILTSVLAVAVMAPPSHAQETPESSEGNVAVGPVGTYDGETQTGPQGRTPGEDANDPRPSIQAEFESCGGKSNQHILRVYTRAGGGGFPSGYSSMRCGSSTWGLRHIEARHRADWQAKANYVNTTWENMLDFAVSQALAGPSSVTYRSSNDTWLYKAPIQIRSFSGALIHQFTSNVVVAAQSKNIITSFPS